MQRVVVQLSTQKLQVEVIPQRQHDSYLGDIQKHCAESVTLGLLTQRIII